MKYFLLISLFAVAATAVIIPEKEHVNGENGWFVPRLDGSFVWVNMDEAEAYLENMQAMAGRLSTNPVTFYLYTKSNPTEGQKITASKKTIDVSNFNAQHPTRICIHGWSSGKDDYINSGVREAWLSQGEYNFIFVDWDSARSVNYVSSAWAVPGVGVKVAALVDFLVENYGLKLDTLEIIGHSLGAHVAGYTGKNIKSGKAHSIVGLDPALPLFNYNKPDKRLSSSDANYVETIHTNGGKLGFLKPIGKGAFYPNGGKSQPGCGFDLTGACSHSRSIIYYAEAVDKDNFSTIKCTDYKAAIANKCGTTYSSNRMGAIMNAFMVTGNFFVPVNKEAPYGKLL